MCAQFTLKTPEDPLYDNAVKLGVVETDEPAQSESDLSPIQHISLELWFTSVNQV